MQIIYEGNDITGYVEVCRADITDNAGGIADSLEIWFGDVKKLWSRWKPEKNHTIRVIHDGIDSGVMFVDEMEQQRGKFILRALSLPQEAKTPHTRSWENVRFEELVKELAGKYGFILHTYGIINNLYDLILQNEEADMEFLARRCRLEGYMLKICDREVVIYDERYVENMDSARTLTIDRLDGDYRFLCKSNGIYGSCRLSYGDAEYGFCPNGGTAGPSLKISGVRAASRGEAERYAKGLLRFYNKHEKTGSFAIKLDSGLAAGSNIEIRGAGLADGKYFCEQVVHRIISGKSFLKVRKPLEGY